MSPVATWGLRYAACVALGLALPFLPAPVRPFVVLFVIFASWALLANDIKQDERDVPAAAVPVLPFIPTGARRRYRPRRVPAAKP